MHREWPVAISRQQVRVLLVSRHSFVASCNNVARHFAVSYFAVSRFLGAGLGLGLGLGLALGLRLGLELGFTDRAVVRGYG